MSHDVAIQGREKLIRMANQIADFFDHADPEQAAAGVAKHINDFWEPRMRRNFLEAVATDASGLKPSVAAALPAIRRPA